jgi:outer membrane protein TolC
VLEDKELDQLKILHPDISDEDAVKVALVTRLDLYNVRDQREDTGRRIELAINGLKPQVDLVASASLSSKPETSGFPVPDLSRYRWNAGFNFDLPLERKLQRNVYRQALIAHEQSARQLEQAEDEIKLQVRADWRNLDQAKRSYEISEIGVELSARRVEEQQLRQEIGLGTARDLVDAQNDLIASKNQRTQALVNHTNARLQFWNDMGILYIKENGQWKEINDAKKF